MSLAYHHSYDQVIQYLWLSAEDLIFHILCRRCEKIMQVKHRANNLQGYYSDNEFPLLV